MIDVPSLIFLLLVIGGVCFVSGRRSVRNENEETVLHRIIMRKYEAKVEREKRKTAEQVARSIDSFVGTLTKPGEDKNHDRCTQPEEGTTNA